MKITITPNPGILGKHAAIEAAQLINAAIAERGSARIVLSTGASQFDTIGALLKCGIDFSKVEMFHLDEYLGMDIAHKASFRKYLTERFTSKVNLKAVHFVDGTEKGIAKLTEEIRSAPVDVGLIGIGENAHIAFNDPPADFNSKEAYIIVALNETCKRQQVGEGWFPTVDDVPKLAITMTCHQIMQCKTIISCVPYPVKAEAMRATLLSETVTNAIPATLLKMHANFSVYIDADSAARITPESVRKANPNLTEIRYIYE